MSKTNTESSSDQGQKKTAFRCIPNEQIGELIDAGLMKKEFYDDSLKSRGTGFAAMTIGTLYPKGSRIWHNEDGTITIVLLSDAE